MTQRSAASSSNAHRVPHRVTVRKTAYQVQKLQEMWAQTHTPTKEQREQIADDIGLETRIVSTWFRDERSKVTRANAEKQRIDRATVGPVRNTRTGIASRYRSEQLDADEDEENDEETPLDRHQQPQPQQQHFQPQARASPRTRYAPYTVSNSTANVEVDNHNRSHPKKLPAQRHFDPLIRASVPIDIQSNAQLPIEADTESYGYLSPPAFPRQSLPAPSISSSETSEDEDELEEDHEGALRPVERPREFSPRTPGLVPSTIPSPRVVHSVSSPNALPPISTFVTNPDLAPSPRIHSDVFLSNQHKGYAFGAKSPFTTALTLPTESGGTYTFQPLPVIIGQLPKRDSNWRFGYYDKVSSMRQTLGGRLHHNEDTHMEDSDASDDDSGSERAFSPNASPVMRHAEARSSMFSGLFGGGKKQMFIHSAGAAPSTSI